MNFLRLAGAASVASTLALVMNVHDSAACGGCFHPVSSGSESGSSVITDHRMAFKISTTETILWDQVRYSGDPTEFAWVLPVRAGAKVELSRDEWIAALDTATQTKVYGPDYTCSNGQVSSISKGSGGGGCGGASTPTSFADESGSSGPVDAGSFKPTEDVQVVAQSVIGPYQAVTIRSTDGKGVSGWLTDNGFEIPNEVKPIIDAYTTEQFDFIALRLRPGQGVRAMRPVRVVTPGADATLPLRMVAAGVGAHVGLSLWIIGEGRYHTQNFPDAPIDWSALAWDGRAKKSNMSDLVASALASNGKRGWITEAAIRDDGVSVGFGSGNPPLFQAYEQTCALRGPQTVPCDETALPPADGSPDGTGDPGDAGAADGGDAGDAGDAGTTKPPATSCTKIVSGCDGYDDYEVATRGLHAGDVWITRIRADLPVAALSTDLQLAAADQVVDSPIRSTAKFTDPTYNPCNPSANNGSAPSSGGSSGNGCACRSTSSSSDAGGWLTMAIAAIGATVVTRRRRR